MKAICEKCHNLREVYYSITINGTKLNFCEPCQLEQRAEFVKQLESGDPKATAIFTAVSRALSKGGKIQ